MTYKKKTALEKLTNPTHKAKIVKIEGKMRKNWGTGTCAIPLPLDVDTLMKKVPRGKVTTVNKIRNAIAKKYKATMGCPICCGIFTNIVAHAAEEQRAAGKKRLTPWWRTIKSDGSLNEKYPDGIKFQKTLLENEGLKIIKKGKKYLVEDFEKKLNK